MQITDDEVRQFQKIWREEFAEEVSADEARAHIDRLDSLYVLLSRPPKETLSSLTSSKPPHQ